jgi:hypothetical protein
MAGGYAYVPRTALTAAGAVVLLCSVGVLSACSGSSAEQSAPVRSTATSPTTNAAAAKAAADKAAAGRAATARAVEEQKAAVKAAGKKYLATQKSGEAAAANAHPMAKAAAACGVPVRYVFASPAGSRIGMPDVPKRGDLWHVKKTSPVSPGMIIYWPDGGTVLCR